MRHRLLCTLAVVALLTGCASGVTRMDQAGAAAPAAPPAPLADRSIKAVTIRLSDEARKLSVDNLKFNPETLRATVERALNSQGIIKAEAGQTLEIEVTSFRVRSGFSATMFGFMAGADNVEGIVTVKDAALAVVKRVKVNASYALGGIAGGQDDARMSWLYEEFAKHTVAEITGVPSK